LGADYHGRMIDQFEAFASGWVGAHYDDLLNIKNNWIKNIIWRATSFYEIRPVFHLSGHPEDVQILSRRICGYFIFSCRRKSDWLEGIQVKKPQGHKVIRSARNQSHEKSYYFVCKALLNH